VTTPGVILSLKLYLIREAASIGDIGVFNTTFLFLPVERRRWVSFRDSCAHISGQGTVGRRVSWTSITIVFKRFVGDDSGGRERRDSFRLRLRCLTSIAVSKEGQNPLRLRRETRGANPAGRLGAPLLVYVV